MTEMTFAEQLEAGTRVRYASPPGVIPPTGWGGAHTFTAPACDGVMVGIEQGVIARVCFEYRDAYGRMARSEPMAVVPGQPCEVI